LLLAGLELLTRHGASTLEQNPTTKSHEVSGFLWSSAHDSSLLGRWFLEASKSFSGPSGWLCLKLDAYSSEMLALRRDALGPEEREAIERLYLESTGKRLQGVLKQHIMAALEAKYP
jgi:hypothetical protein